jgi:hypothetical protein
MSYLVQVHVYSGRPDPVWRISDDEANQLFEAQRMKPHDLFEARSLTATADEQATGGLGYRGFSLTETKGDHPQDKLLTLGDSAVPQGRTAFIRGNAEAEHLLLKTGERLLHADLSKVVREAVQAAGIAGIFQAACPACHGAAAPVYDPAYWNGDPTRLTHNNCYNYANNHATNTFAQPGRATGHMYTALDCAHVRPAAESDGLHTVPNFSANTPGWYVALVIWPGNDYHWYRQDKNGCWSHKPGGTAARNIDNAGHTISDPKTCNRGPYTVFCTYMTTTKAVHIS